MTAVTNVELLEAMFVDLPDDAAAMLAGFPGDPNDESGEAKWKWSAAPWCHGKPLPGRIGRDTNNYVVISSFNRGRDGKYRRRKDQFRRLHAVMVDDVGTKITLAAQRLPPSARIETSPGNHQDFLFIEPTAAADDAGIAARLLEELVEKGLATGGVDPGMLGTTRYARLPVGINGKAKYVQALGHPFRTRIVEWAPQRRYSVERIAQAFTLDLKPPAPRIYAPLPAGIIATKQTEFGALMQALGRAGLYQETRGDWHHVICPWAAEHSDRSLTGTAIREPNEKNGWAGFFKCHHSHGGKLTIRDVYRFVRDSHRSSNAMTQEREHAT